MEHEQVKLKKKYGFFTAIAMVIGTIIGGGVFFKAEKILNATGGNLPVGILSWIIGGGVMIVCAYVFATMATKYEKASGVVDYAEAACGAGYGYFMGWFVAIIYFPALTASLAFIAARYTSILFGWDTTGGKTVVIAAFYLIASYVVNALAPILAGKFQVATTVIKMIPLLGMAVVGLIVGLLSGMTVENFTTSVSDVSTGRALFTAVVATSYAYEGWIMATCINAELKDAKKNLPRALIIGTCATIVIYVLYYIGLAGGISNAEMMQSGERGALISFSTVFSHFGGSLLMAFVLISCLGTLNGVMMGATRGIYSLAIRDMGPAPHIFKEVDPSTNMATNSSIFCLFLCSVWFLWYYADTMTGHSTVAQFTFDITELPVITIYTLYIPIFIRFMMREKDFSFIKRFIIPALAIASCLFMVFACCFVHQWEVLRYLIIFVGIMLIGIFLKDRRTEKNRKIIHHRGEG